jgi:NADPH:quinone reductase-like Zn-dependent oxidoreductase
MPSLIGCEGVGRVVAAGREVTYVSEGDLTLLPPHKPTWVERVKTNESWLRPLPDGDVDQFSMLGINPATAYVMLTEMVVLRPGDWVIQNGANSPVGRALAAIAKTLGIKTVNVVRRQGAADEIKDLGGDVVLVDGPDLPRRVAEMTGGAPIGLAVDMVGGEATLGLMGSLAPGGMVVVYGGSSLQPLQGNPLQMIFRDLTIRAFWFVPWFRDASPEKKASIYGELAPLIASGAITAPIAGSYGLEQFPEALKAAGAARGKVLFKPSLSA